MENESRLNAFLYIEELNACEILPAAKKSIGSDVMPMTGQAPENVGSLRMSRSLNGRSAVAEANMRAEFVRDEHKKNLKRKASDCRGSGDEVKKLLNRQSAAASRVYRIAYIRELEKSLDMFEQRNIELNQNVLILEQGSDRLQRKVDLLNRQVEFLKLKAGNCSVVNNEVNDLVVSADPTRTNSSVIENTTVPLDAPIYSFFNF
mmetsp:Transcript_1988/g.3534  ORF Transcript_1988/g.3534 Transcript_1988/m.3534 type:complete len:205 (-) Transcript_1988:156-770(-)|eukprot:CAMPEP_0182446200 /NCGR_PEP_ID=MMETSP1172-20130603/4054_1 /TAXON_ID=708627 /ORGANISM="Timspurckia oligopyrenoides, Strain CCMP3278" /LENGTH=204 /DNA_ID=CAMNT_0024642093 /DNA_START=6 /DNA_END=620 /DNA_ORIENTATION=-